LLWLWWLWWLQRWLWWLWWLQWWLWWLWWLWWWWHLWWLLWLLPSLLCMLLPCDPRSRPDLLLSLWWWLLWLWLLWLWLWEGLLPAEVLLQEAMLLLDSLSVSASRIRDTKILQGTKLSSILLPASLLILNHLNDWVLVLWTL
jgi:hypothetical protein